LDNRNIGPDWVLVGGLGLCFLSFAITAVLAISIFR